MTAGDFTCYTNNGTQPVDCAVQDLQGAVFGEAIFGLLVSGLLITSFYVATNGGLAVPAVMMTILGGVLVSVIPPQYQSTVQIIIFVGLVSGLLALANKYLMQQ